MVELTPIEKELWKAIQELPINHKDYMKRGDMKRIQNKRKLLEQLKHEKPDVCFYYHVEFDLFAVRTEGWYPDGPDDVESALERPLERHAIQRVKKVTFTGKWE